MSNGSCDCHVTYCTPSTAHSVLCDRAGCSSGYHTAASYHILGYTGVPYPACVCVCVREREGERERECVCV